MLKTQPTSVNEGLTCSFEEASDTIEMDPSELKIIRDTPQ